MTFSKSISRTIVGSALLIPTFLSMSACKKDEAPATASTDAGGPSASPVASGSAADAGAAGTPWYPAGANQSLKLTWAVYPPQGSEGADPPRNLEIVARIGSAVRRVMIGPQRGELEANDQSVCKPSLKTGNTVSVLTFNKMGVKTFFAKRVQPDLLEISYFVAADPEERGVVAKIPVPADAQISDAITDIQGVGNEKPFDCAKGSTGFSPSGAVVKVQSTAKAIDTSDWKSAAPGSTLSLRWTADQTRAKPPLPTKPGPSLDMSKVVVPLDLVLTLNGRSHSVSFQTNAGAESSEKCGKISFYWADLLVPFELRRAEGGKAVLTKGGNQVYAFDLPAGVKVTQELIVVDPTGKRTSNTKCTPQTL